MSLHTFVIDGRKRLQISQSKTEPGKVLVQVLDSARDVLVSCTMDAQAAAVVSLSQAGEREKALQLFQGGYRHASNQVTLLLKELRRGLGQ